MNILYYFPNFETNMFQWQKFHFMNELEEYNCFFEIISPFSYENKEIANRAILNRIKTGKFDLFMTSYHEDYLEIGTLQEIKKMGIATLLFCPDNLVVPYNHKNVAKFFDLVWLTSQETKYMFDNWGANSIFLPYAANPKYFTFDYPKSEELSIGFIGTPHGSRISTINHLIDHDIPITVHTTTNAISNKGFKTKPITYLQVLSKQIRYPIGRKLAWGSIIDKIGRYELHKNSSNFTLKQPVDLEHLSYYNSKYALTLSFTNALSTGLLRNPVKIVNLRNFELPMSGAIQFCEYSDEMAEYFDDGKEIVMYKNNEDCIEKAKFYLNEDKLSLRQSIRFSARKRAEREHTWYARFSKVFYRLGLSTK